MIIVTGTMNMEPACIADFERDVAAMRPSVLTEDGCTFYAIQVDDAATGLVNVIEHWRDDDALKVHFTQPWVTEFFGRYGGKMLATTVQIYDIAGPPRPLPAM